MVHSFCVEVFYGIFENFVSRPFKCTIIEGNLTWTQFLFKIRIINFVNDIVRIKICCLDKKAMLGVFTLTWRVKVWKLSKKKIAPKSNKRFCSAVFLRTMIIQILLSFYGEIGTLGKKQCICQSTFQMVSKIRFCSLGTTFFTSKFFLPLREVISIIKVWQNCLKLRWILCQFELSNANERMAKNMFQVLLNSSFHMWKSPLKE